MTMIRKFMGLICHSLAARVYGIFLIFPIFLLQLCFYLNVNDRPSDLFVLMLHSVLLFFVMATVAYMIMRIIAVASKRLFVVLSRALDILFVALIILTIIFPVQYTLLDGQKLPDINIIDAVIQCCIPVLLVVGLFFFHRKRANEFHSIRLLFFLGGIFFIFYSSAAMHLDAQARRLSEENQTSPLCELGKRNVIFLVVETLQGSYLEELAHASPELFSSFSGVTLFPRAVTPINWSPFSTIHMFSGNYAWAKCATRAEAVAALEDDSSIVTARDSGYRFSGGMYTPVPGGKYAVAQPENIPLLVRLPQMILTYTKYYFAAIRRLTPAVGWPLLQKLEGKIYSECLFAGQYPLKIAARDYFVGMTKCLRVGDQNAFLYFFNYMTHLEILFDRSGNTIPYLPQNKETQLDEYRYTISLYADFLNKLKQIGAYDNSLIIITGDHGAYNEPGLQWNPVVMVKPPHAEGELAISRANVLLGDIRPLVEAYMQGDDVFAAKFEMLTRQTGPREIQVFTYKAGPYDHGPSWEQHTLVGDIDTVIQAVTAK